MPVVHWQQLRYRIAQQQEANLEHALFAAGAQSLSTTSTVDSLWLEQNQDGSAPWQQLTVSALFPEQFDVEQVMDEISSTVPGIQEKPIITLVEDRDWVQLGRELSSPIKIATSFWVVPSWCETPDPEATNLSIDPGLAFGAGGHATTLLCLQALARLSLQGARALDYGCGSGILAIAALWLGAESAVAVDVDSRALQVTQQNAELNGVRSHLRTSLPGDILETTKFDLVIANILASVLLKLAPVLLCHLAPGATLLLSGILKSQIDEVRRGFAPHITLFSLAQGDWFMLQGVYQP